MPSASTDSWFLVFSDTKNSDKKWSINGCKMSWQQLLRPLPSLLSSVHVINLKPWACWIRAKDVDEWRAVYFRFHSSETPFLSKSLLTTVIALKDKADNKSHGKKTMTYLPWVARRSGSSHCPNHMDWQLSERSLLTEGAQLSWPSSNHRSPTTHMFIYF